MHHLVLVICYFPDRGQEVPTLEPPNKQPRSRQ
jgi:hypothetical protein